MPLLLNITGVKNLQSLRHSTILYLKRHHQFKYFFNSNNVNTVTNTFSYVTLMEQNNPPLHHDNTNKKIRDMDG